jgi:hypothetical protein
VGFGAERFASLSLISAGFLANRIWLRPLCKSWLPAAAAILWEEAMKPQEQRGGHGDLFRAGLEQIISLQHALVKLAGEIDWPFLEQSFGAVYTDAPGRPPLPTRLMAGLEILKYSYNLSDERLCEVWLENPYFQYFCGEAFFRHELPFDRSSMTRWRQRMGEERLKALLQESLAAAAKTGALKPSELTAAVVDTTVQPKNVMFPTDAKLLNRARERLARLAQKHDVALRQAYTRVGKLALIKHQRYAHAKQFTQAQDVFWPYNPRYRPQNRAQQAVKAGLRQSLIAVSSRADPAKAAEGSQSLLAACP